MFGAWRTLKRSLIDYKNTVDEWTALKTRVMSTSSVRAFGG